MGSDALRGREAETRLCPHPSDRPDIVVLDEATSALDPDSQDKLMELLTTSSMRPRS